MGRVIHIDQRACSGCGSCAELCPEAFVMDEDREVACVLESCDVPEDRLHEAVATCPEACIFVEEDDERR